MTQDLFRPLDPFHPHTRRAGFANDSALSAELRTTCPLVDNRGDHSIIDRCLGNRGQYFANEISSRES